jgi:hypothetical protein
VRLRDELAAGEDRFLRKRISTWSLSAAMGLAASFFLSHLAVAQVAPPLGAAAQFGALGNSGVTGSTGLGTIVLGGAALFVMRRRRSV